MVTGFLRGQLDGPAVRLRSLGRFSPLLTGPAQIVVGLGLVRSQSDGLLQMVASPVHLPQLEGQSASLQVAMGALLGRGGGADGNLQGLQCILQVTCLLIHRRELGQRPDIGGIQAHGQAQFTLGADEIASAEVGPCQGAVGGDLRGVQFTGLLVGGDGLLLLPQVFVHLPQMIENLCIIGAQG